MTQTQKSKPSAEERQKALDSFSELDLEELKDKTSIDRTAEIDEEWLLMAEFAKAFGWEAYKDARDDKIPLSEVLSMVEASRVLYYQELYSLAQIMLIALISSNSKKPSNTFGKLTKHILNRIKVGK